MPSTKRLNGVSAIDETEPLLAPVSEPVPTAAEPELQLDLTATPPKATENDDDDDRPLPVAQILFLCYVRLMEPVAFFSVFAFLGQMLWEIGDIEKEEVGFYYGLVGSLFSLTEMLLMIPWGRASDRFGRKPVLVISLTGVGLATGVLGFGQAIWQLVLLRCLAGFFAATIVTVRTMISENSSPKTQARAFGYFSVAGNIGILVGPLIGGALSEPAKQYPSVFGGIKLFEDFPYALATICIGLFGLSAALVAIFFIKETLGTRSYTKAGAQEKMTIRQLLNFPGVLRCVYLSWHLNLMSVVYTSGTIFIFSQPKLVSIQFQRITDRKFSNSCVLVYSCLWGRT
ncbi:major facilitator superfamily transporter protein [Rutstroemia sp. NJR-2017a BBW]|nr:major facilitator superfamily transporter protein [Rutstroemia sp. NJR-2017a BBW]